MADDFSKKLAKLQKEAPEAAKAIELALEKADKKFGSTTEAALRLADALIKGADAQKALNTALDKTYQNYLKVATETEKIKLAEDARVEAYKRLNTLVEQSKQLGAEEKEKFRTILESQELQLKNAEKQAKTIQTTTKDLKKQTKEVEDQYGWWEKTKDAVLGIGLAFAAIKAGGAAVKLIKGAKGSSKALNVTSKSAKAASSALHGADDAARNLSKSTKGVTMSGKGLAASIAGGGLLGAGAIWGVYKLGDAMAAAGRKMKELITFAETTYMSLSDLTTGFASLTGQVLNSDSAVRRGGKGMASFASRVIQLQRRNQMLGASIEKITESYKEMFTASRTFGKAMTSTSAGSRRTADSLAEMAFRFTKVGLTTQNFAAAVDVLGKTYRKSKIIDESKSLGTELVNIARVTGQLPDMVAKDFGGAMNTLAAYSLPKAREIFKKLSATVAETGMEMSDLLGIAAKFDDIDAAAESVGELNAMMGGPYLNTLDLVNANEIERIELLKEAMDQTGKNFNQQDRFMQKAIAQQLGVDVQKASRMFAGDQEAINESTKAIDTQGASFQKLVGNVRDGAARNATSIKDQMAAVKESTVLMEGAFAAIDKMSRKAMGTFRRLGHRFRQDIGQSVVGALQDIEKMVQSMAESVESGGSAITALGSGIGLALMSQKPGLALAGSLANKALGNPLGGGAAAAGPGGTVGSQAEAASFTASPATQTPISIAEMDRATQSAVAQNAGISREELLEVIDRLRSGEIVLNVDGQTLARASSPFMPTATGNPGGRGL